jgi:hypothetical protein
MIPARTLSVDDFPAPVATDEADGLAGANAQRDVVERAHGRRPAAPAAQHHLVERPAAVGADREQSEGVLEDDLARLRHNTTASSP